MNSSRTGQPPRRPFDRDLDRLPDELLELFERVVREAEAHPNFAEVLRAEFGARRRPRDSGKGRSKEPTHSGCHRRQGMDRMFESSIREGKPVPHFAGTDAHQVVLNLEGQVRDVRFLKLLEEIGQETLASFSVEDLMVLEKVFHEDSLPDDLRRRVPRLLEVGVLERVGRGRGVRYMPARRFYKTLGKKAAYTRRKGLDRDTNKALLLQHIRENAKEGCRFNELRQVLPALSYEQVRKLLQSLRREGAIRPEGTRRHAVWFPGDEP